MSHMSVYNPSGTHIFCTFRIESTAMWPELNSLSTSLAIEYNCQEPVENITTVDVTAVENITNVENLPLSSSSASETCSTLQAVLANSSEILLVYEVPWFLTV